ncbi:MAG: DUF3267 domain-containing protein [Butyricicoccus sp.]
MKLIYKGKFNGDPASVPHGEHKPNAVPFREIQNYKTLSLVMNAAAIVLLIPLFILLFLRGGRDAFCVSGCLLALLSMIPHEFLHAVCFRETVYLYRGGGLLFVTGPEDMSRRRFVFLSLLPNLVFGFVPFVLFLMVPQWSVLGSMGALCITMGAGDYYNVMNALTQMPKGARTYLYGIHSYWYLPDTIK